jgi:nucleoside transporter
MTWKLYLALSFAMFMEYAIWGAWFPVLASRLLGPLKMTGKQTGWIYATLPLACIVFPIVAGQFADQYFASQWIIIICHLAGAVLLFLAARQAKFANLFVLLLVYSAFYTATLPLINSMMFNHLEKAFAGDATKVGAASGKIFLWAPVAWALAGYFLTGWRWKFKTGEQGKDCLYLAAVLSAIMVIGALLLLPDTPAAKAGTASIAKAFSLLRDGNFLLFIIVSMVIAGLMPFYFQGTAPFMQDIGVPAKNVPASMAIAQVVQALATFVLLGLLLANLGYKWTLIVGAACWGLLYVIYVGTNQRFIIIPAQALHGLAYVFFIIVGQVFTAGYAGEEVRSSAQGLIFAATSGLGMFLGSQVAGSVMDKFRLEQKFQWRKIFIVPVATIVVSLLALLLFFKQSTT